MLRCLRIHRFAIIDALEVNFTRGLNVITGETGAGKSILIDALELVLGGRAKPEIIRTGEESAEVEALFDVGDDPSVEARLTEMDVEADGELIIRRVVQASGRAKAYVNGRLVTAKDLESLARGLADISSQHEHHTLVDTTTHLEYLDAFAKLSDVVATMGEAYNAVAEAKQKLDELQSRVLHRREREDLLRFQLREIEDLNLVADEDLKLAEERDRFRYAEKLAKAAGEAEDAIYSRDGAICEELARLSSALVEAARIDSVLAEPSRMIESALAELEEASRELREYSRGVIFDPSRLETLEERLDKIGRLKRKHGGSLADVLAFAQSASDELLALENHESLEKELESAVEVARSAAQKTARSLSEKRRKGADALGKAIGSELSSLGMGSARVLVDVARHDSREGQLEVDGARLTQKGIDRVEFLIAPNKGEVPKPLRKIASGGELSRAMLAIKGVLRGLGHEGVYVFDEVDSGVGGAVAEVIGRKLFEVSRHHQVLCITHVPQIAVYADSHYVVQKEVVEERTRSDVRHLGVSEVSDEIARMLGGIKITDKTRAAAKEMLREARLAK